MVGIIGNIGYRVVDRKTLKVININKRQLSLDEQMNMVRCNSKCIENLHTQVKMNKKIISGGRSGNLDKYPVLDGDKIIKNRSALTVICKIKGKYVFADGKGKLLEFSLNELVKAVNVKGICLTNAKIVFKSKKPILSLLSGSMESFDTPIKSNVSLCKEQVYSKSGKKTQYTNKETDKVKENEQELINKKYELQHKLITYLNIKLAERGVLLEKQDAVGLTILRYGIKSKQDLDKRGIEAKAIDSIIQLDSMGVYYDSVLSLAEERYLNSFKLVA